MRSFTSQSANNSPLWSSCLTGQMRLLWDSTRTQNMKGNNANVEPLRSWSRITQASWKRLLCLYSWNDYVFYCRTRKSTDLKWFLHTWHAEIDVLPFFLSRSVSSHSPIPRRGGCIGAADQHSEPGRIWKQRAQLDTGLLLIFTLGWQF